MLDAKGNSAVFLFYAYARIRSIQRKAGIDVHSIPSNCLQVKHPAERDLALKLLQFPDVIEAILGDLHLHHLTDYLWELCNTLTGFYMKCKARFTRLPHHDAWPRAPRSLERKRSPAGCFCVRPRVRSS
eukprot:g10928.t1